MLLSAPAKMTVAPWRVQYECYRLADVWITAPDGAEYLIRVGCATARDGTPTRRPLVSEQGRLNRHTGRVVPSKQTAKLLEPVTDALRAFLAP